MNYSMRMEPTSGGADFSSEQCHAPLRVMLSESCSIGTHYTWRARSFLKYKGGGIGANSGTMPDIASNPSGGTADAAAPFMWFTKRVVAECGSHGESIGGVVACYTSEG